MRQTTNQLTLQSYHLTIAEGLLAGQTLTGTPGCTVTINGAAPALPYLLKVGDVLAVTHNAGSDLSGLTLLAALVPDPATPGTPADPDPSQWTWSDTFNRTFLGGDYTPALSSTIDGDQVASINASALLLGQNVLVANQGGQGTTPTMDFARVRLGAGRWNNPSPSVQYDCSFTIATGVYALPPVLGVRIVGASKSLTWDGTHLMWGSVQLARIADLMQPGTTYRNRLTVDTASGRIQISRDSNGVVDVPLPADWAASMGGQGLVELIHETSPVNTGAGVNTSYTRATFDNFAVRDGSGNSQQSTGSTGSQVHVGTLWRFADGPPDDTVGNDTDVWVEGSTGSVYQRVNGAYQVQINLRGPQGERGEPGLPGASGGGVARLSSPEVGYPRVRGNGGFSGSVTRGVRNVSFTFTADVTLAAEGLIIGGVDQLGAQGIDSAYIQDADGVVVASGVGSISTEADTLRITFERVANLPRGTYTAGIGFSDGTRLVLSSPVQFLAGADSFQVDGDTSRAPTVALLSNRGNTVGQLGLLSMRVVSQPTPYPAWTDGAFELVAPAGGTPYLRTRSEGVDYTLTFTPVSSGGGGGQES